jgi:hypothetical protein
LKFNKPVATAYCLEENTWPFRGQPGKTFAGAILRDWIKRETSEIRKLQQMERSLETHGAGLLAYSDDSISTGLLEETNNKIMDVGNASRAIKGSLAAAISLPGRSFPESG